MFDDIAGWKLGPERFAADGSYISASPAQLARLNEELARGRIAQRIKGRAGDLRKIAQARIVPVDPSPAEDADALQEMLDREA